MQWLLYPLTFNYRFLHNLKVDTFAIQCHIIQLVSTLYSLQARKAIDQTHRSADSLQLASGDKIEMWTMKVFLSLAYLEWWSLISSGSLCDLTGQLSKIKK